MKIIREVTGISISGQLDEVWEFDSSFAVIPEKTNLSEIEINNALSKIPIHIQNKHFVLLTSGSTGVPKFVIGNKARSEELVKVLHKAQELEFIEQTIVVLPLSYSFALINQWLWAKIENRKLISTEGFSNATILKQVLDKAENAMICLVGAQIPLFKQFFAEDCCFYGVNKIHFAGGHFPQASLEYIGKLFPNAVVFNNYGCVEAMPRLTLRKAGDASNASNIGKPISGVELKTLDENKMVFKSPYRAVGFVEKGAFIALNDNQWIPTGDNGKVNEDGSWTLFGRGNEIFKRYGEKISIISLAESVSRCWDGGVAFYKVQDSNGEQGCVLVVSPEPESKQWRSILQQLRKDFSRVHWPLRLESVEKFPFLSSGKIDMQKLEKDSEKNTIHWRQRI